MNFRRWTIARRLVQLASVGLIASPLTGFTVFQGTLAAGDLFGLPLADPLAALQVVLASGVAVPAFILSALGVTLFYFLLGGRTFCGWVCPVHLLTEMSDKVRVLLGSGQRVIPLTTKLWTLLATVIITAITGLPLFEVLSPIGMTARAIAFSGWLALACLGGLLLLEITVGRHLWCRSLCPLGGFYSLVGSRSPLRLRFHRSRCTNCGNCTEVCPVEEVLAPSLTEGMPQVRSGDCTRCGRCIDFCAPGALTMGIGYSAKGGTS
jgi:ferredoxin-type protein NapH